MAVLRTIYGDDVVFIDVESLVLGQRFEEVILERIRQAKVMLVVMGPGWQAVRHRPDGEPDLFQVEVDTAMANNTTIAHYSSTGPRLHPTYPWKRQGHPSTPAKVEHGTSDDTER